MSYLQDMYFMIDGLKLAILMREKYSKRTFFYIILSFVYINFFLLKLGLYLHFPNIKVQLYPNSMQKRARVFNYTFHIPFLTKRVNKIYVTYLTSISGLIVHFSVVIFSFTCHKKIQPRKHE